MGYLLLTLDGYIGRLYFPKQTYKRYKLPFNLIYYWNCCLQAKINFLLLPSNFVWNCLIILPLTKKEFCTLWDFKSPYKIEAYATNRILKTSCWRKLVYMLRNNQAERLWDLISCLNNTPYCKLSGGSYNPLTLWPKALQKSRH